MPTTHFGKIELKEETAIATANATKSANTDATLAAPTVAEFNAVVDLVNELKSKLNAICKG